MRPTPTVAAAATHVWSGFQALILEPVVKAFFIMSSLTMYTVYMAKHADSLAQQIVIQLIATSTNFRWHAIDEKQSWRALVVHVHQLEGDQGLYAHKLWLDVRTQSIQSSISRRCFKIYQIRGAAGLRCQTIQTETGESRQHARMHMTANRIHWSGRCRGAPHPHTVHLDQRWRCRLRLRDMWPLAESES